MSKKIDKEKKEKYGFTLKGLFISLGLDLLQAELLVDGIELHLRRHYKDDGYPAIVLGDEGFEITSVRKAKKSVRKGDKYVYHYIKYYFCISGWFCFGIDIF